MHNTELASIYIRISYEQRSGFILSLYSIPLNFPEDSRPEVSHS